MACAVLSPRRTNRMIAAVVFGTAFGLVPTSESGAATPQFAPVADSTGPLGTQLLDHAMANNGNVAFVNLRDDGQYGLYRWNGSSSQTLVETSAAVPGWTTILASPAINSSGQVSFIGLRTETGGNAFFGIYRAEPAGAVTTINEVSANQSVNGFSVGTDINAAGAVAFHRSVQNVSRGIYTHNGTTEQTIFEGASGNSLNWWSINSAGHAAVAGTIGGVTGVWRGSGDGNLTPIATGTVSQIRTPVLDDAGVVTFGARLSDGNDGIVRGDGTGAAVTLASTAIGGPFTSGFGRTSANNDGDVAFIATPTAQAGGIYFLPDGAAAVDAQRIIGVGDGLFGGTVETLSINPRSLNDADQMSFTYRIGFTTGPDVWGIAVATVPEPTAATCLGVGLLGVAASRRHRRV